MPEYTIEDSAGGSIDPVRGPGPNSIFDELNPAQRAELMMQFGLHAGDFGPDETSFSLPTGKGRTALPDWANAMTPEQLSDWATRMGTSPSDLLLKVG